MNCAAAANCNQPPPLWFPLFFIALWLGVSTLLSLVGGWFALSQHYRAAQDIQGQKFRMTSGSVGWSGFIPVGYGNCLIATVGDSGLRLGVFFLFRLFHPTLFIPWSAMESVEQKRWLFYKGSVISIRGLRLRITLYGGLGQAVFDAFNRSRLGKAGTA
jgi:hypothetical protein